MSDILLSAGAELRNHESAKNTKDHETIFVQIVFVRLRDLRLFVVSQFSVNAAGHLERRRIRAQTTDGGFPHPLWRCREDQVGAHVTQQPG
jgi:hypothetical protein